MDDPDKRHRPAVPSAASRRQMSPRWTAVGLLMAAGCINFIDRSAVSIALPDIRAELHLSAAQAGLLLSAFAWSYAVAQLPAGSLVDRIGARWALAGGLAAWSAVQAASGLVVSLRQFVLARVALGMGESPMFVGGARVCADRFPPEERALPLGLLNASASLGPALAPLLLTPLIAALGWRASFAALGAAGLLVAVLWAATYRDASDGAGRGAGVAGPATWLALLRQRSTAGLLIGFGGTVYLTWLYVTWLPSFLADGWGMPPDRAALWSAAPQCAGFVGAVGGGWLADRLARTMQSSGGPASGDRARGELSARRMLLAVGLLGAALGSAVAAVAWNAPAAIAAVACALFCANLATTAGWSLAASLAPSPLVATVEAMANIGGSVGGSLAPLLTGLLVEASGSFAPALWLATAVAVACAGGSWFLVRKEISDGRRAVSSGPP